MAITKKSKMGSMLGMNPSEVSHTGTGKKEGDKALSQVITGQSNKPRFELIAGEAEQKVSFFLPDSLYLEVSLQAKKERKTIKQFLGEMILNTMMEKYGFKP